MRATSRWGYGIMAEQMRRSYGEVEVLDSHVVQNRRQAFEKISKKAKKRGKRK